MDSPTPQRTQLLPTPGLTSRPRPTPELPCKPNAYRLAFGDPESLLRRETRGIRLQLEIACPTWTQMAQGIENTLVIFGSARFQAHEDARQMRPQPRPTMRQALPWPSATCATPATNYERRAFGRTVAEHGAQLPQPSACTICTGAALASWKRPTAGLRGGRAHRRPEHRPAPRTTRQPVCHVAEPTSSITLRCARCTMMRAKAMVAFPGGFARLDELFEVITPGAN